MSDLLISGIITVSNGNGATSTQYVSVTVDRNFAEPGVMALWAQLGNALYLATREISEKEAEEAKDE